MSPNECRDILESTIRMAWYPMTWSVKLLTLFGLEYPDSFYADSTRVPSSALAGTFQDGDQCLLQAEAAQTGG